LVRLVTSAISVVKVRWLEALFNDY
jgi:hypothetical protein